MKLTVDTSELVHQLDGVLGQIKTLKHEHASMRAALVALRNTCDVINPKEVTPGTILEWVRGNCEEVLASLSAQPVIVSEDAEL